VIPADVREWVLKEVTREPVEFGRLWQRLGAQRGLDLRASGRYYRAVDRALQSLRRADLIRFNRDTRKWEVAS
jgi:hypothetical protein